MSISRIMPDGQIKTFAGMVYVIYDPDEERLQYVGKTVSEVEKRLQKHISDPQSKIGAYIKNNPSKIRKWLILRIFLPTEADVLNKEKYFIGFLILNLMK